MDLKLRSFQHFNCIVEDYEASLSHLKRVFDAEINYVLRPEYLSEGVHACLLTIGPVNFEVVGAAPGSKNAFRRRLDTKGPGYMGIEFDVGDLEVARKAVQSHGIRIKYDPKRFFVTDSRDTFGLTIEGYDRNWYRAPPDPTMIPVGSVDHWLKKPLGVTGLHSFSVAVKDRAAAAARWLDVTGLDHEPLKDADGALWLPAADTRMALVDAAGKAEHIAAVRLTVNDIDMSARELAGKGLAVSKKHDGVLVVSSAANHGLRLEFVQEPH